MTHTLMIAESADARFDYEQRAMIDIRERKAQRSKKLILFEVKTEITLERDSKVLGFDPSFDNQAKDHRLRVVFDSQTESDHHFSESIYEQRCYASKRRD